MNEQEGRTADRDDLRPSGQLAAEQNTLHSAGQGNAGSDVLTPEARNVRGPLGETEPRRYCRKCLTREMGRDEYFRNLHEYIAQLDPDLKVGGDEYEARLAQCKTCEKLLDGMCRVCGCYVELRAAMKKNRCPLVHPRWERSVV